MSTRTIADTSMEERETKVRVVEEQSESPPWVAALLKSNEAIVKSNGEVCGRVDEMLKRMDMLENRIDESEIKQQESNIRIVSLEEEMQSLKIENAELRGENAELKGNYSKMREDLDDQIDRSLRDHVNFYGLSEPTPEKKWADTENRLARWLAEHFVDHDANYYRKAFVRCHRGPFVPGKSGPRPIFCKMDFKVAEELRWDMKNKATDGVTLKNMYSENTQERINKALIYRKQFKCENPGSKSYVSHPATLKVMKANEKKYSVEKVF